ncbi:30S ribosomal protein S7 [candidate division WWE3 bacterium]|jgi:small subunit ribosomal protein S7|uniref:Small ribosomal subunit protein uS7 n=1 Tax=candidate division WWE3 bacterium TaxID=2053526 RepID=A0A3A4ZL74_UNCKA|nr:MAG: 30S ribosomal protein S7 [candidate division WWE3 bacterium]
MRSKKAKKRIIQPDPIYKSKIVERMINILMMHGKKSIARTIVYDAIDSLAEDKKEAIKMFEGAVKNVMPVQEVRSRRVGGATYQVPMPLKHDRSEALALRWIAKAARGKSGRPMQDRLADELKNAYQGTGDAIKKREDTHRMADANRAFAHFARY